jgi:hypothetical protein
MAAMPVRYWTPPSKNYESNFGDYPKLPWRPYHERSPYQYWDDPIQRRQYGEPIHEEFEIQDAFFPGEHSPWTNFKEAMEGQLWIFGLFLAGAAVTYLITDEERANPPHEIPPEVLEYLNEAGKERINRRPYEVPRKPTFDAYGSADGILARSSTPAAHH